MDATFPQLCCEALCLQTLSDVDLCGQHFRERKAGIKKVPTCSDHSFLQIVPGMLSAKMGNLGSATIYHIVKLCIHQNWTNFNEICIYRV
jgi:hypothetical protein